MLMGKGKAISVLSIRKKENEFFFETLGLLFSVREALLNGFRNKLFPKIALKQLQK